MADGFWDTNGKVSPDPACFVRLRPCMSSRSSALWVQLLDQSKGSVFIWFPKECCIGLRSWASSCLRFASPLFLAKMQLEVAPGRDLVRLGIVE